MTTINDLIDRWNTDEGRPFKGKLIDMDAYEKDPDNIGCMCAQGQVLHLLGGWSADMLKGVDQQYVDKETAKILNISRAHAVLLRIVNDRANGAPSIVLTDPSKVLGDQWSKVLDFWHYFDGMTKKQWDAAHAAVWADAAHAAAWDAAARRPVRRAVGASYKIHGAGVLKKNDQPLRLLAAFGFSDVSDIPARPAGYGKPLARHP